MKILLADDNHFYRLALEATLKEWGYEVIPVSDGAAALEALTARRRAEDGDPRLDDAQGGRPGGLPAGAGAPRPSRPTSSSSPPRGARRTSSRRWRAGPTTTSPSRSTARNCRPASRSAGGSSACRRARRSSSPSPAPSRPRAPTPRGTPSASPTTRWPSRSGIGLPRREAGDPAPRRPAARHRQDRHPRRHPRTSPAP